MGATHETSFSDQIVMTQEQMTKLLQLKDRAVRRDIDAATCGTALDWDRAHEADEKLDDFLAELGYY
jgi:hypothetical protein